MNKYKHIAFPFGTSEFPYKSKRPGGGGVSATTKIFSLKTKTPMGQAGIREMVYDCRFTHKGTYAVDRFGQVNFYNPEVKADAKEGDGSGLMGSVFDQIDIPKTDCLDRLVAIDCKNARYHEWMKNGVVDMVRINI